ncbi:MAG: hypothetical protein QOD06_3368, partial [Candidatus Binatota bacterium]|nr:hypothetical protein [Candidatus Binatota bacterium]
MNAIELLTNDHRKVDSLIERYRSSGGGGRSGSARTKVLEQITRELTVHAEAEEAELYPVLRSDVSGGEEMAEEAEQEHAEVKRMIADLEGADAESK